MTKIITLIYESVCSKSCKLEGIFHTYLNLISSWCLYSPINIFDDWRDCILSLQLLQLQMN